MWSSKRELILFTPIIAAKMKAKPIKPIVLKNRDQVKNTLMYVLLYFSFMIISLVSYFILDYFRKFIFLAGLSFVIAMWFIVKALKIKKSMPNVIEFIRIDENGIRLRDEKEYSIPWNKIRSITFYNKYPNQARLHMGIDYEKNGDVASLRINLQPYIEILRFRKWKKAIDYYSGREDIVTNKHLSIARLEADDYDPYSRNKKGRK